MATVMPLAISPNSMKRSIAWKPTRISSQTDSTGENSTANCERWLKIARCGYDLQDSSRYHRRRRQRREARDQVYPTDRFEAGNAGPDLGRGENDIERPSADRGRMSVGELSVAKAGLS